ncbi:hypothetical protein KR51_00019060 [Rubidibacter lacunae KORDI 51-2]|uniref:Uncharacterized protein n=1 Tax=Rubidibacter lacunae KORDI 51-2 TaxID=582515 RepID=U5DL87_9CHRO|nr:hypothetical protein [Rubidibacter lacunae]ERN41339.1 hypothetical protein KR51_00019060 [Rubidibacter lacunae KORDI 51-2]
MILTALNQLVSRAIASLRVEEPPAPKPRGKRRRTLQLDTLIAEAWAQGIQVYERIIEFVRDRSGVGCSRRAIARWKRENGLLYG